MNLSLQEILEATKGTLFQGDPALSVTSISTDTRTLKSGDAFVCLSGPNFDGHEFIDTAIEKGARLVLLQKNRWSAERWGKVPLAFVSAEDPLWAFGEIARTW